MRKAAIFLIGAVLIGTAGLALSSPFGGQRATPKERIGGLEEKIIVERYKGGERACVIVLGDHEPVVKLEITVHDEKGRLITEDKAGGDLVAVVWYPPRDGNYTIKIKNFGEQYNDCYIAFK